MPILNKPFNGKFGANLFCKFLVAEPVCGAEWLRALTDCHGANETRRESRSRGFREFMFSCAGVGLVVFYDKVNICFKF